MEARTLTTKKGMSVETTMTNLEALEALATLTAISSFAADLVSKARKYGLSADQWAWAHKLVIDDRAKKAGADQAQPTVVRGANLRGLVDLLTAAQGNEIKWPKIRLEIQRNEEDAVIMAQPVVLSLCGAGSRNPGAVRVTNGRPYGSPEARFYGMILPDGSWDRMWVPFRGLGIAQKALTVLEALAADPASVARVQGALTGCCSFCGKELTTRESVGAGYGPVCAEKWNLPWGAETAAQYETRKNQALAGAHGTQDGAPAGGGVSQAHGDLGAALAILNG
jgi:hypothetical protein